MTNREYNQLHRMKKRAKKRNALHEDRVVEFGTRDGSLPRGFYKDVKVRQDFEKVVAEYVKNPISTSKDARAGRWLTLSSAIKE